MKRTDKRRKLVVETTKQIHLAIKNCATYPGDHPMISEIISKSYEAILDRLREKNTFSVCVFGEKLMVEDIVINGRYAFSKQFKNDLIKRSIDSITFHHGLSHEDFTTFLNAMKKAPFLIKKEGGVAAILQQYGIRNIQFNQIRYGKISGKSEEPEDDHLREHGRGEGHGPGVNDGFNDIPGQGDHRVSDFIVNLPESLEITDQLYARIIQAETELEVMNQIAHELISKQGERREQFREKMRSILAKCDESLLKQVSQSLEIPETDQEVITETLVNEFYFSAVSGRCADEYLQNRKFDEDFIRQFIPSEEYRQKVIPRVRSKLESFGDLDTEKIIHELNLCELVTGEKITGEPHLGFSDQDEISKSKGDLIRLLSNGQKDEARSVLDGLLKKLDDTSWKIRKGVSEGFMDVAEVLDRYDILKENFREISSAFLKRVEQENYIDIYLNASESLQRICTMQNRNDLFLRDDTVGYRLLQAAELSKSQLQKALWERKKGGASLQYSLGELGMVDEAVLTGMLAQKFKGCPTVILSNVNSIPTGVLRSIPVKYIQRYRILPFKFDSGNLFTATMTPNDLNALNDLHFISGFSVIPHFVSEYFLLRAIKNYYHIYVGSKKFHPIMEDISEGNRVEFVEKEEPINDADEMKDSDGPVIRLVNLILKDAIHRKASDIHIEPYENELRVRFRIDGTLATVLNPSITYGRVVSSRLKVMSRLDISEKRLPQDGRFKIRLNGSSVDFRVSTFPSMHGEKVVLRLLNNSDLSLGVKNLGLDDEDLNTLLTGMHKSRGMILITGPTGSGKTTTLYSILNDLNDGTRNISTAEDPIEYNLRGINQFQMNMEIGLDFPRALRTLLRQDPDIIMVGEIRDSETAEIAVKAALTGHLVLSTLHTNSAPETITRLLDMNIEPYLINSCVNLVVAQRLMRVICPKCKVKAAPTDLQRKILANHDLDPSGVEFSRGEGCDACNNTGYRGRTGIYELMPIWDEIREMISANESAFSIGDKAQELGLTTLQSSGFKKVKEGITSLDEWIRTVV